MVRNTTCILQQAAGDVPGACVGMSVMAGQCLCCGLKYHLHTAAGCGCCTRCVCWHVSNGWTMPVFWSQISPAYCSRLWVLYQVRWQLLMQTVCHQVSTARIRAKLPFSELLIPDRLARSDAICPSYSPLHLSSSLHVCV